MDQTTVAPQGQPRLTLGLAGVAEVPGNPDPNPQRSFPSSQSLSPGHVSIPTLSAWDTPPFT